MFCVCSTSIRCASHHLEGGEAIFGRVARGRAHEEAVVARNCRRSHRRHQPCVGQQRRCEYAAHQ
eukprot:1251499-Pleurochrysis_carterae.AAC.1